MSYDLPCRRLWYSSETQTDGPKHCQDELRGEVYE
jgi:hypothetical protein